jgi:hypothetical protein
MTPIEFREQTLVIAKNQPPYLPFPAHYSCATGRVTACWKLTWRERLTVLFRGRVWHQILTSGTRLQPQKLTADKPAEVA